MEIINHKKPVEGCIGNTGKFSPCFQSILVLTDSYVKNLRAEDFHPRNGPVCRARIQKMK